MTGRTVLVGDVVLVAFGIWPLRVTAKVQILGDKKRHWRKRLFGKGGKISRVETYRAYLLSDSDGHYRDSERFLNVKESQIVQVVKRAEAPDDSNIVYLSEATTGAA